MDFMWFLIQVVGISLSGVMAPGPVTAATLAAGTRRPHAGALIALGHGIVEFPLMALILVGMNTILALPAVQVGIGLAGGAFLALLGVMMLRDMRKPVEAGNPANSGRHPLVVGIALTGGNPYFLLWWATVGLGIATRAQSLGIMAFAVFAVVHWLCDLVWLEILSLTAHKGARLLGPGVQRIILGVCGMAMLFFAAWFCWDALGDLASLVGRHS